MASPVPVRVASLRPHPLLIVAAAAPLAVVWLHPGRGPATLSAWVLLPLLLLGLPLHELVHAGAARAAGAAPRDIRIGLHRGFFLGCHCRTALSRRGYAAFLLAPLGLTVLLGGVAVLVWPRLDVGLGLAFLLLGCGGDVALWARLRRVDPAARVRDHPSEVGFDVLPPL